MAPVQPDSLLNQISRARFLQVGVYYLTMFLLLKTEVAQRILSEDEKKEILTMGPYVALHYLPWMLCAKYAPRQVLTLYSFLEVKLYMIYCSAPISLLQQIQHLRQAREEMPCAITALEKWERHLNFLSPELVAFNIFDASLNPEERKAMVSKLYGFRHQWHPGDRLIYGKSVPGPNFCTGDAFWPGT